MSDMPKISGIHHVTLSVSDVDRTIAWYESVLGFAFGGRLSQDGMHKALMRRGDVFITFVEHGVTPADDAFNETRMGLDHLAFAVADRAALETWAAWLDELSVTRGEIGAATMGDMLAFRDPDNIALEFYTVSP